MDLNEDWSRRELPPPRFVFSYALVYLPRSFGQADTPAYQWSDRFTVFCGLPHGCLPTGAIANSLDTQPVTGTGSLQCKAD